MQLITKHQTKQDSQRGILWAIVIAFWLFGIGVSSLHAQKHQLNDNSQCHICLTNFNHSPFIATDELVVLNKLQISFRIEKFDTIYRDQQPTRVSNRGPPLFNT